MMTTESKRLREALVQWRDSLVNLSFRNRLLNYRPSRASTLEFSSPDSDAILRLASGKRGVYTIGTKPSARAAQATDDASTTAEVFDAELNLALDEFDYSEAGESLYVDKTQRDVTRILKRLAADARREWVDKGLSVLYLAFGALHWLDDAGDKRVSPLILVPVTLVTDGPRKPHRIELSEDEIAINPALALKLAEYGLTLPLLATIESAVQDGEAADAIRHFKAISWPAGWSVQDSVVLANFMFAKEAMYRDLLENEEDVLESGLIAALASALPDGEAPYAFEGISDEEIDSASPPEETPLVLNADASQRAAVLAANSGKSFVLDGPPGTGKSQTIANIIASLIRDGKTVLFVSEKVVALEVVRERLSTRGLDAFLLELHSSKAVRSEVARSLGSALDSVPIVPQRLDPRTPVEARALRESLTNHVVAMNETRTPLMRTLHSVFGELASTDLTMVLPPAKLNYETITPEFEGHVSVQADRLAAVWDRVRRPQLNLWRGLESEDGIWFEIRTAQHALRELDNALQLYADMLAAFELTTLADVTQIAPLQESWGAAGNHIDSIWLTTMDLDAAQRRLLDAKTAVLDREARIAVATEAAGASWAELSDEPTPETPGLETWIDHFGATTAKELNSLRRYLQYRTKLIHAIAELSSVVSKTTGLSNSGSISEAGAQLARTTALLVEPVALPHWLDSSTDPRTIRNRLTALAEIWDARAQAETEGSKYFNNSVLHLPVQDIVARIEKTHSPFARLSSQYRTDMAQLRGAFIGEPKTLKSHIHNAASWKSAVDDANATIEEATRLLGNRFAGTSTLWPQQLQAIANLTTFVGTDFQLDIESTKRLLGDSNAQSTLTALCRALADALPAWGASSRHESTDMPAATLLGPVEDIATWLGEMQSEADAIHAHLAPFERDYGDHISAERAEELRSAKQAAIESAQIARDKIHAIRELLPDNTSEAAAIENLESAEQKLAWTREMRSLAHPNSPSFPLTADQVSALTDSPTGIPIVDLHERWISTRDAVVEHFHDLRRTELIDETATVAGATELLSDLSGDSEGPSIWARGQDARSTLTDLGFGAVIDDAVQSTGTELAATIRESLLRYWVGHVLAADSRLHNDYGTNLDEMVAQFRKIDGQIIDGAVSKVIQSAVGRRPKAAFGQAAIIRREAEKKKRHIAVRDLVGQARDVIQAIHPCFMMSPLAVSQYLPADLRFDYVIFDEASQVMPGDAINCIYRGKALITAGDQKQLPPTNFFAASSTVDEDSDTEDLAADFESVLDLMKSTGHFPSLTLKWHYRSRHEHLIAYSNASFYGSGLKTFPGALDESPDLGVKYLGVPNAVYRRGTSQDNPVEAAKVAERVMHHFENRPDKTLGVVAFSAAQRDAIDLALQQARADRPDMERHFNEGLPEAFFVKNLEYVQGDERDVMIFSTGYGPDDSGKVYRNFGALNRAGGERRLNVAITRARELVEVISSMTAGDIGDGTSEGVRHFRRYLDFAQRGPTALAIEAEENDLRTDSPFEDAVIAAIQSWGYKVRPQVGVAGYRIDIGVYHPTQPGAFMLGVECDGAMYHSSRAARDRDRLRHEILEGLGWKIHHIWGTAWYRHTEREMLRLRDLLNEMSQGPVLGRAASSNTAKRSPAIEIDYETVVPSDVPDWAKPYECAPTLGVIPAWVDASDGSHARMLTEFVRGVVEIEAPVHYETLAARLREATGLQRVGSRIQGNLLWAADRAGAQFREMFFYRADGASAGPRTPTKAVKRKIEHIANEELSDALVLALAQATGASESELIAEVCRIYGWQRKTFTMTYRLENLIEEMVLAERIVRTERGLRRAVD